MRLPVVRSGDDLTAAYDSLMSAMHFCHFLYRIYKICGNVEGDQPSVQLPAKMPDKAEEFISAEEADKLFKKLNKIFEVNCIKRST